MMDRSTMDRLYTIQADGCIICPYNRSHVITSVRFVYHLMKCSKSSGKSFEICPFNAQHHVVEPYTLEDHVPSCRSKAHAETERAALAMGEPMTVERREAHLKYEESARMRTIEAVLGERRPVERENETLPAWLDEALGPCVESEDDKPIPNMIDDFDAQFAKAANNEAAKAKKGSDGKVPIPAYAIEAENMLRKEYSLDYENLRLRIPLKHNRPVGLGRAQNIGIIPFSEVKVPTPRPVPHQYMLDFNKQCILDSKRQFEDAHRAEPSTIQDAHHAERTTIQATLKPEEPSESNSECSFYSMLEDLDLDPKDNEGNIESKEFREEANEEEEKMARELSELELVFYSTSLPNFPKVTEAFKLMLETAKKETSRPK